MNLKIAVIFCFCLFAAELNCQVINNDSSGSTEIRRDKQIYRNQDSTTSKPGLNDRLNVNNLLIPDELFLLKLRSTFGESIQDYSNENRSSALPLTLSMEYQLSGSQKDLTNYLNSTYLLSKPTKLQQILGIVDFSGAVLLTGYHIWKYYIKKEK